jgi:C4-dicarboxylate transporter, DctM subunit
MAVGIMLGLFAVLLVLGVPVSVAMGLSAVVALVLGDVPLVLLPQTFFVSIDNFSLLAIPLFVLAGELMNVGGITDRIVSFSQTLVGHFRAGLAKANIATNTFMSAISGSAIADVTAVGSMMIPAMIRQGYRPEFAVAVTSCAAMLGPIIPPSIMAVIYGSLLGVSIGKLFLAGILPGLAAALAFLILVHILSGRSGGTPVPRSTWRARGTAFVLAAPAIALPLIIVGGIMAGILTPTETGGVAVAYALAVALIRSRLSLRTFFTIVVDAAVMTSSTLVVLAGAAVFSWVLARSGAPQTMLKGLLAISQDPTIVMLLLLAALFVLGTFLEPLPTLILIAPVLNPLSRAMGYDPVTLGICVLMMLVLGAVSPPVGILAMIAAKIAKVEYARTFRILVPFMLVWILMTILTAFFPPLTTYLPSFMPN